MSSILPMAPAVSSQRSWGAVVVNGNCFASSANTRYCHITCRRLLMAGDVYSFIHYLHFKSLFMKYVLPVCFLLYGAFGALTLSAQTTPFTTKEYLDINNIRAAQLVHGDMWWDPATSAPQCEYPKGSGNHVGFAASLWMAGYDSQGHL